MNAVEIEEAISALAEQPFDAAEFPFGFPSGGFKPFRTLLGSKKPGQITIHRHIINPLPRVTVA